MPSLSGPGTHGVFDYLPKLYRICLISMLFVVPSLVLRFTQLFTDRGASDIGMKCQGARGEGANMMHPVPKLLVSSGGGGGKHDAPGT